MELINTTPLAAHLSLGRGSDGLRRAVITAKATFNLEGDAARLERSVPQPVLEEAMAHGGEFMLPSDLAPGVLGFFQVMLVGHLQLSKPVQRRSLCMRVGRHERRLDVSGDRRWVPGEHADEWRMPEPAHFTRMPLAWSRAYGGALQVEVDQRAIVPLVYPANPEGLGYWPAQEAKGLAEHIGSEHALRLPEPGALPNLESPGEHVEAPTDQPMLPACWAPIPPGHAARYAPYLEEIRPDGLQKDGIGEMAARTRELTYLWAHPSWALPIPAAEPLGVSIVGLRDEDLSFEIPALGVHVDARVGARGGSRPLVPQMVVILVDDGLVTVTYRLSIAYRYLEGERRAVRVRLEEAA